MHSTQSTVGVHVRCAYNKRTPNLSHIYEYYVVLEILFL